MEMQPGVERVLVPVHGHVVAAELFDHPQNESWIALSLPGHSPGHLAAGTRPETIDARLFADLAEAALAAVVGMRPVIVVGWSTGGFAALALAARHPQRVAAVASLAGFAKGSRITGSIAWLAWLARGAIGAAALRSGLWLAGRLPWLHHAIVRSCAADRRAALAVSSDQLGGLHQEFASHDPVDLTVVLAALATLDIDRWLGDIRCPVWIAAGGRDPLVPLAEARSLAAGIRDAKLTVYDTAGDLLLASGRVSAAISPPGGPTPLMPAADALFLVGEATLTTSMTAACGARRSTLLLS